MKWLNKELRLSTSILTPLFLLFAVMLLIPNYPGLVGAFFICFGIFHSYQNARENNDILYSALLPVRKRDVVSAKFQTALLFELLGLLALGVFALLRLTVFRAVPVYAASALLPPNLTLLGGALLIFALFNRLFIAGFFKTAWRFGGPFISFIVTTFVLIAILEILPHLPGLGFLAGTQGAPLVMQLWVFLGCAAVFALVTLRAVRLSQRRFEQLDL